MHHLPTKARLSYNQTSCNDLANLSPAELLHPVAEHGLKTHKTITQDIMHARCLATVSCQGFAPQRCKSG